MLKVGVVRRALPWGVELAVVSWRGIGEGKPLGRKIGGFLRAGGRTVGGAF